jgi:hypothetical protein
MDDLWLFQMIFHIELSTFNWIYVLKAYKRYYYPLRSTNEYLELN